MLGSTKAESNKRLEKMLRVDTLECCLWC